MADRRSTDEFDDPEGLFSRLVTGAGHTAGSVFENRSLMISAAVFVSVVVLSGVIWASYPSQNPMTGDGSVPIIRADAQPYKYTPSDRGGMNIPHQDSTIFAALKNEQPDRKVENLLGDSDEQPMDRQKLFAGLKTDLTNAPPTADDGIKVAGVGDGGYAQRPMSESERRAEAARRNRDMLNHAAEPLPAHMRDNSGRLPDVLRSGDIKPGDGEHVEIPEDMRAPKSAVSDIPVNDPRVPKPVLVEKANDADDVGVQPGTQRAQPVKDWTKPTPVLTVPKQESEPTVAFKTAPAVVSGGNTYVQVASVPDQARVAGEWAKIAGGLPMLSGKAYRVQNADIPGKGTFYRIQVGPMSKDAAVDLCTQIKAKKPGGCLIAK